MSLLKVSVMAAACLAASASMASVSVSSVLGSASNMLDPMDPNAYANMTFNLEAGTSAEANSKGLVATFTGNQASRTIVTNGVSPYGVNVWAPGTYDGNGYFGIGLDSSLTLTAPQAMSSISVSIGSIDSFNTVQILGAGGSILGTFTGDDLSAGVPANGIFGVDGDRRVTFAGLAGTDLYGIRFFNTGAATAFEFDNVTFMPVTAVPEAESWAMMLLGLGALGVAFRRRQNTLTRIA